MKFILGKKLNMTQMFDENGAAQVVTVLDVKPLTVTRVKTASGPDGYDAIQVGAGTRKEKNVAKPQRGALKELGYFEKLRELRGVSKDSSLGDKIEVGVFEVGEPVQVSAISKGKGFQGVVKRHGFHGGPRSHGQKHSEREPGSIGMTGPQRVFKGKRMAGRMGSDRVTVKNLTVAHVDSALNQLFIKGAIPGRRGTWVEVRGTSKKTGK